MEFSVAGKDYVRSQDTLWVGELLDSPHDAGGLRTPFRLDEGRHVETGTVLGLKRAVVFADDEIDELFHESRVPLFALWIAKVGDQREVKISVGCVAGDSGDETVLAEQFLEVFGSLRQAFRRKAHVLRYERRALGTVFSDQSEQSFAYVPRQLDGFRHAVYVITLLAAASSSGLLIAPVALHRLLFQGGHKQAMVRAGHAAALPALPYWLRRQTMG